MSLSASIRVYLRSFAAYLSLRPLRSFAAILAWAFSLGFRLWTFDLRPWTLANLQSAFSILDSELRTLKLRTLMSISFTPAVSPFHTC